MVHLVSSLSGALSKSMFPQLPEEKATDYLTAVIIAILFPLARLILDKTLYHVRDSVVSGAGWSTGNDVTSFRIFA